MTIPIMKVLSGLALMATMDAMYAALTGNMLALAPMGYATIPFGFFVSYISYVFSDFEAH